MTNTTPFSDRLSCLALLCACAMLLAWAAPIVMVITGDSLGLLRMKQNHAVGDLAAEQPETADVTDDPALLCSSQRSGLHPLVFSLLPAHLPKPAWSLMPPVRPPIVHA